MQALPQSENTTAKTAPPLETKSHAPRRPPGQRSPTPSSPQAPQTARQVGLPPSSTRQPNVLPAHDAPPFPATASSPPHGSALPTSAVPLFPTTLPAPSRNRSAPPASIFPPFSARPNSPHPSPHGKRPCRGHAHDVSPRDRRHNPVIQTGWGRKAPRNPLQRAPFSPRFPASHSNQRRRRSRQRQLNRPRAAEPGSGTDSMLIQPWS